jgi:hypothetical protein
MTRVEDELKNALRRREPPQGFTHRVLARAAEIGSRQADHAWRELWLKIFDQPLAPANLLRWATVTVLAAGLVVGGVHYRSVQRERTQGEAAKQRLLLALRIAGRKLQLAKTRVDQINSGRVNSDQLDSDPMANQRERE